MPIPKDRRSPCDCQGGWFYVNEGSITVVPKNGSLQGQLSVTRRQLIAALKLMRKRTSDRGAAK
jgi:hypothetical protein